MAEDDTLTVEAEWMIDTRGWELAQFLEDTFSQGSRQWFMGKLSCGERNQDTMGMHC